MVLAIMREASLTPIERTLRIGLLLSRYSFPTSDVHDLRESRAVPRQEVRAAGPPFKLAAPPCFVVTHSLVSCSLGLSDLVSVNFFSSEQY